MELQIREFFQDPTNQELIRKRDYKTLYDKLDNNNIMPSQITRILLKSGINPLEYMHEIPHDYYGGLSESNNVEIPNNIMAIGNSAFRESGLVEINIPNSVTVIHEYAFSKCKNLKSIAIPDSVKSISRCVFGQCDELTDVKLSNNIKSIPMALFYCCKNLKSIIIPDKVTTIKTQAFCGCTSLKSVVIGSKLKSIGALAFYKCRALEIVNFKGTCEQWREIKTPKTGREESKIIVHCLDADEELWV